MAVVLGILIAPQQYIRCGIHFRNIVINKNWYLKLAHYNIDG